MSQILLFTLNVQIAALPMGTSTFWFLPSQMSQATLMGRNGSNACTFITLFMASTYIRSTNKNILELYVGSPLNSSWITLMLSSIVCGNNAYDCVTLGIGSPFFSVADAKANLSVRSWKFNSWGYHRSLNHNNRPPNPPKFSGLLPAEAGQRTKFGGTCHRKWNDHLFCWIQQLKYTSWIAIHTTPSDQCLERWLVWLPSLIWRNSSWISSGRSLQPSTFVSSLSFHSEVEDKHWERRCTNLSKWAAFLHDRREVSRNPCSSAYLEV